MGFQQLTKQAIFSYREIVSYFSFLTPLTSHRLNDLLLNKTIDSAIVKNKVISSVLRGMNNIPEKKHDKSHKATGSCISQQAISRAIWDKNNSHPTRKSPQLNYLSFAGIPS